jgi:hypothetical protein
MNLSEALQKAVGSCAQPYYKHKRRLERESRLPRDYSYIYRPPRVTLEDQLFELFEEGYKVASGDGAIVPMTRQLYYVMRRLLQESGCTDDLSDAYHRTVLEKYEITIGKRLCYRKSVGDMIEPHSGCPTCGGPRGARLGTESVENYVVPKHRFNKILYVEKTGFMSQLLQVNIHNRFDIAIAAGAGFSPQAAKELFAKIEKEIPVKIYVLHDADISGLEIARTLGNKLIHEDYNITVEDLGLRPAEAIELDLPTESVDITSHPSLELRESISKQELKWLLGEDLRERREYYKKNRKVLYRGTRVELNAFTPSEFIAWVEEKLESLAGKVVPERDSIAAEAAKLYRESLTKKVSRILLSRFNVEKFISDLPALARPTVKQIRAALKKDPELGWRDVIRNAVEKELVKFKLDKKVFDRIDEK